MKFVIVTGMSGAGKSTALKMLEDMGYFCVDNLPIALLPKFAELAQAISVRWLWAWISETAVPWMRWPRYWKT